MTAKVCKTVLTICSLLLFLVAQGEAQQCGSEADGALCPGGLCCSKYGYCGTGDLYCGEGCQSQCGPPAPPPPPPGPPTPSPPPAPIPPPCPEAEGELTDIIDEALFEEMLKHRNADICPGRGFYNYQAFINASKYFPCFGTVGSQETRKREVAAFFGQTSHETKGGWPTAPDGPYAWGYCFNSENHANPYCEPSNDWPCVPGKKYYGRGPIQISYNYNYGPAGAALSLPLLSNPDLVETDADVSFRTAFWFWMTPQSPKPSCHDVVIGKWIPTPSDIAGNRVPGYGVLTNIINGGLECNIPSPDARVESRIGFYKRYCDMLNISYGENLDCYDQRPFNWGRTWSII